MSKHLWRGNWKGHVPDGDIHQRARTIIRPTGGIVRGKFPSRKNGRMVHHEGLLELDAIYLFEASPRIIRYREQPRTIHFPDGARLRKYTPDFELQLAGGELITVEVKPTRSLRNDEVRHKFETLADHMRRSSIPFAILTEASLRTEPRLSSLRRIYHRAARTPPTNDALKRFLLKHWMRFPLSIETAVRLLQIDGIDPYSLLLAGKVCCPLDAPVSGDTILNINSEVHHEWFWISEEHGF
jgi:hypothetical protein